AVGSQGFRAYGMAQLARSYLTRAGGVDKNGFLPYELLGVGEDDPVVTAMLGSRLGNIGGSSGRCERSLARRLLEHSILFGGVVAPEYVVMILRCDGASDVKLSNEIVERLQILAESGDPIAHAALGIVSERDEQNEQKFAKALAHYQVASLIL